MTMRKPDDGIQIYSDWYPRQANRDFAIELDAVELEPTDQLRATPETGGTEAPKYLRFRIISKDQSGKE